MKTILTLILCFAFLTIKSVEVNERNNLLNDEQMQFNRFVYALALVESRNNSEAINAKENARGKFQIRPIRLKDYNNRTGSNYSIEQMHNDSIAIKVFNYYAKGSYEQIARNWNGGPRGMNKKSTVKYWYKVNKLLTHPLF